MLGDLGYATLSRLAPRENSHPGTNLPGGRHVRSRDTYVAAHKKLINTSHPEFRAVTAIRGRIIADWKRVVLPFPEPAIRLIREDYLPIFRVQLTTLQMKLPEAV